MVKRTSVLAIMRKEVVTATPDASILDIARIMLNNKVGSVVIVDSTNKGVLKGIVTWSDVIRTIANKQNPSEVRAADVMTKDLITASPNDSLFDVSKLMVKHNIDRIPVVENGKLIGIVSDKDVLVSAPELLEILSEKIKASIMRPPKFSEKISGICEKCEAYSDELRNVDGQWVCPECL